MSGLGLAQPMVSMSEAQAYVRIETGEEEAVLAGLVRSASALCEAFLGRVVIARAYSAQVAASADWQRLPVTPVLTIDSVQSVASDGALTALPSSDYAIDIDLAGDGWVRLVAGAGIERIAVGGMAGMADNPSDVPEPLRQGVLRLVAHLFAARDGDGGAPPAAVTALWRPFRRLRFA